MRAYVCDEVKVIHEHLGKITPEGDADISKQDVIDALAHDDWSDELHHIFGDTSDTIYRTKLNNAAIAAICTPSK